MSDLSRADIAYIESILNVVGVVRRATATAPPQMYEPEPWPWHIEPPPRHTVSHGWRPTYEGEQPPF